MYTQVHALKADKIALKKTSVAFSFCRLLYTTEWSHACECACVWCMRLLNFVRKWEAIIIVCLFIVYYRTENITGLREAQIVCVYNIFGV